MENKEELAGELQKLIISHAHAIDESNTDRSCEICDTNTLIRKAWFLSDKQGYMRGVEEALRVVPKEKNCYEGCNCLKKAHDAISKLKEV